MKIVDVDGQKYKKPGVGATVGGVIAGSAVNGIISNPAKMLSPKLVDKMNVISDSLSADEFKLVEDSVGKVMKKTGLADKGVSVLKVSAETADEAAEIMIKEAQRSPIMKLLPKQAQKFFGDIMSSTVKNGDNAFYAFTTKKIVLPDKKLTLAFFHEAGHAMNANMSKIGKFLQKSRQLQILAIPIALIALLKAKKAPGEEPKNGVDKTTTFIKNNAGKLTLAVSLPALIEEGMATFKGNKLAKELLSGDLFKKVVKSNKLGYISYAAVTLAATVGIALGVKAKDAIAKPKPVES